MKGGGAPCLVCGERDASGFRAGGVSLRRCAGCGFEWQREPPGEAELASLYADDYLDRWGIDSPERLESVRAAKRATYRAFLERVRRHKASGRLLDVGCALGFGVAAALAAGFDAYGLDRNRSAVARAREELGERVHAGPLDASAFPGMRFDVVTLIDVLEHAPAPERLLAAVADRLAPGGVVAAVLPDTGSRVRRILGRHWPHYTREHLHYFSAPTLRRFLEERGFEVRAFERGVRKTFTAHYLAAYARALGHRLLPALGALGDLTLRIPTGEMLVVAARAERAERPGGRGRTRS